MPKPENEPSTNNAVSIKAGDEDYALGQLVTLNIKNPSDQPIDANLKIERREAGEWQPLAISGKSVAIKPMETENIMFASIEESQQMRDLGRYRVVLSEPDGEFLAENEFTVSEPGLFRSLWRGLFFKPIYNILIFFLSLTSSQLAIAIIVLTLLIKFILLVPSRKGIIAQQKMQKLQPEIDQVRKKYGSDPQKQAQEMMALWKKHKINPGSAFWPILIQFPILIALFFVVKDGLQPFNSYLLYPVQALQNFDFATINYHFFWADLSKPDPFFILPIAIGLLQFWQMHSMSAQAKKKKAESGDKKEKTPQESVMEMMKWILPGVIIFISATLPAAVGLYWGVSTAFAIVQQHLIQKTIK